jgi:ribosomal protein S18 acetylase RimI-like enzyme
MELESVRRATVADIDGLAVVLGSAFVDDPMMRWLYSTDATRPVQTVEFMQVALELAMPYGHVYSAGDNSAGAIWAPPGVDIFSDSRAGLLFSLLGKQLGARRAVAAAEGLSRITAEHPREESHFYLFVLGTGPRWQGRGLGRALMDEVLKECEAGGLAAYLESSNVHNVPFYERHGFKVRSEVHVSDEFVSRPMWRDATQRGTDSVSAARPRL